MTTTPGRLILSALGIRLPNRQVRSVAFGEAPVETNWVSGGILLMRSALFKELGGFDPRFFLYFEETDLLLRVRARGWRIVAVGHAHAYHEGYAAAKATGEPLVYGCIAEHFFRSRYYYLAKNYGRAAATITEVLVALAEWLRQLRDSVVGRKGDGVRLGFLRRPFLKMPERASHVVLPGRPVR